MNVQIDFPDVPKVSDRPEKQEEFARWYEQFKTCLLRQFEEQANEIDQKQDST